MEVFLKSTTHCPRFTNTKTVTATRPRCRLPLVTVRLGSNIFNSRLRFPQVRLCIFLQAYALGFLKVTYRFTCESVENFALTGASLRGRQGQGWSHPQHPSPKLAYGFIFGISIASLSERTTARRQWPEYSTKYGREHPPYVPLLASRYSPRTHGV